VLTTVEVILPLVPATAPHDTLLQVCCNTTFQLDGLPVGPQNPDDYVIEMRTFARRLGLGWRDPAL
jgi:hypothetical protein